MATPVKLNGDDKPVRRKRLALPCDQVFIPSLGGGPVRVRLLQFYIRNPNGPECLQRIYQAGEIAVLPAGEVSALIAKGFAVPAQ